MSNLGIFSKITKKVAKFSKRWQGGIRLKKVAFATNWWHLCNPIPRRWKNVIFEINIRIQKNGHNFLWLKDFSITLFAFDRGWKDANYYTVRSIIYYTLLKRRQKSSLIPFPPPDGSFDCPHQAVFFRKKFYRKKLRFRFFSSKIRKKLRFSSFYSQYCF